MDKTEFREGKRINILYTMPDMFGFFFYESQLSWNCTCAQTSFLLSKEVNVASAEEGNVSLLFSRLKSWPEERDEVM